MNVIVQIVSAGAILALTSCSPESGRTAADVWVAASSLRPPNVPYTPNPIITARETETGMWIWHVQEAAPKNMSVEELLAELAATRSLRPDPVILYSFAHHDEPSERTELRSRIARAAGCSSSAPCIEGTPEQLP